MTEISTNLEKAKLILQSDELVAIPTETVYGLAANALSENAVKKIFALKNRPAFNPLIVHIASISDLDRIAKNIPPLAMKLAETFWPGPLTLLLEKKSIISDCVTAGNKTVAVRIPNHPLTLKLLSELSFPLAAPSANPFMSISPTNPQHVKNYFDGKLKFILDGGSCIDGIESTIVGFRDNQAVLYREGSCEIAALEKIAGILLKPENTATTIEAPGMLKKHYAPKTKLVVTTDIIESIQEHFGKKIGVLSFTALEIFPEVHIQKHLSSENSLKEAATNLYSTLIELDSLHLDLIIAEYMPDSGLGNTINDRLERASSS